MNKVLLIGRLGGDPVIRYTEKGTPACFFSMATDEYHKKNGERLQITEWHQVITYSSLAEICSKYLSKGREVFVEGKIRTEKWTDDDGVDRLVKKIIASSVRFFRTSDSVSSNDTLPAGSEEDIHSHGQIPEGDVPY